MIVWTKWLENYIDAEYFSNNYRQPFSEKIVEKNSNQELCLKTFS